MKNEFFLRRTFLFIKTKISEKEKSYYALLFLLTFIINFILAITNVYGKPESFSEILYWNFSREINLIFTHTLYFLILISKALYPNQLEIIYTIKLKSRLSLFLSKILTIFTISIFYVCISVIIIIFQSLSVLKPKGWSDFLIGNFTVLYKNNIGNIYMIPFIFNLIFYFIVISLLYFYVTVQNSIS